jgi:anti-sigma regulatory factor (Ser/Thr protein kinase)
MRDQGDRHHGDSMLTVDLPQDVRAASIARSAIRRSLAQRLAPERLDALLLTTTELVTNAVVHGDGDIRLNLRVDEERVRGEVVDDGRGFEHEIRERGPDDFDGRGLMLVSALTDAWGVHEGTTHVWFELDVRGPDTPGFTEPKLGEDERPAELD